MQYVSEETDLPVTITCRFVEIGCIPGAPAVALRGQWAGGDVDRNPQWVPVCSFHDKHWDDIEGDPERRLPEKYRLPRFVLPA